MRSPAEHLQRLLRFDTTNPPGNERACVSYIAGELDAAGVAYTIRARSAKRPNLVARVRGRGQGPPLVLYGHVDVVETEGQTWSEPPFAASVSNGVMYGRGALDMKGAVAVMLSAFLTAARAPAPPPCDLVLAVLADEEAGSAFGASYLVKEHPELFEGVKYALGEVGGFNVWLDGRPVFLIQVAEKRGCRLRWSFCGRGGHASIPRTETALGELGRALTALEARQSHRHVTPAARAMLSEIALNFEGSLASSATALLEDGQAPVDLTPFGTHSGLISAMLTNTAVATIVRGGDKGNVIPSTAMAEINGRLVPGCEPMQLVRELRQAAGAAGDLEIVDVQPTQPPEPDWGMYPVLAEELVRDVPGALAVPFLMPAGTDGRFLSSLGIQTYGCIPLVLPEDLDFFGLMHAADERVPVDSLESGLVTLSRIIERAVPT